LTTSQNLQTFDEEVIDTSDAAEAVRFYEGIGELHDSDDELQRLREELGLGLGVDSDTAVPDANH
jgi:hypothetical protein